MRTELDRRMQRARVPRAFQWGVAALACLFLALGSGSEARAAAGDFTYDTGSGTSQDWAAFGDSIMAGYCGVFCSIKSYGSYYADYAAAENSWQVSLDSFAQSGETTIQIYDEMANGHLSSLQNADLVIWSAGGNNFLDARDAYAASCDVAALDQALAAFKDDWNLILDLVAAEAAPGARIRTMDVYYPNPDQDRQNFCGSVSDFEVFYPRLVDAGNYICNTAYAAGFLCASSLVAMNCDELDANHTIYPTCFDPSGDNFRDPLAVTKYVNGTPTQWPSANNSGMIQSDRTHPGAAGMRYIAEVHHELGYSDQAVCGDLTCSTGETPLSCPSDCPDVCGDGLCSGSETASSCATDCAPQCIADGDGLGCTASTNCCSGIGNCTGGKPANRVCAPAAAVCGDGVIGGSEECESGLPLADSCTSLGFSGGTLACGSS
ncbi:MAG: SGNH/GDSL hydrolase family protein [Deltaproteobacteria bacterium]|jgi:lysophospholipase L1-like esterase|nr:SGNH/GDSL hydrolase family protein [Deltaproteobacteria bacterium]